MKWRTLKNQLNTYSRKVMFFAIMLRYVHILRAFFKRKRCQKIERGNICDIQFLTL